MKTVENVRRAETKLCKKCNCTKDLYKDFYHKNLHKEARCKTCVSQMRKTEYKQNRPKHLKRVHLYRTKNPRAVKNTKLKQAYGITLEQFEEMLAEQKNLCAICSKPFNKTADVDHNHQTGEVRALLHSSCNTALGLVKEDVQVLHGMISYIHKFQK